MKKRLLTILSLALAICAMLAMLSVFAAASGTAEESEGETAPAPEIVSKNVSYASKLHLLYAIPKEQVPEGSSLCLKVSSANPTTEAYTLTEPTLMTISAITGEAKEYYVFYSKGIAAKDLATPIYATPTLIDEGGVETLGKTEEYSVIEYCYERLMHDGFINVSGEDTQDLRRRRLYEALIEYNSKAYAVFGDENATDPDSLAYASVKGSYSDFFSSVDPTDTITVTYDPSAIPKNYLFVGWRIIVTGADGSITETLSELSTVTVSLSKGATSLSAVYVKDPDVLLGEQIAEAEIRDAANRAAEWAALEERMISKLGYSEENAKKITDEMKNLYTLYGPELVDWVASLYAKGYMDLENGVWAGGFYATVAGRDAYGFGPDLQCTVQLLRFLQQSGVISSIKGDIPEWMQIEMVYFAKSLQHENGYFYHPQWGKEFTDEHISRRGRDLGWGTSLLSDFGAKPQYDTPNGVKGDGVSADEYLASLGIIKPTFGVTLTSHLGESTESRVRLATLVAAEEDASTAYLKTLPAFINYLLTVIEPGMKTNQYSTGNTLNATNGQISYYSKLNGTYTYTEGDEALTDGATAEDYKQFEGLTMMEMVIKVLIDVINPKTGLYGGYNEDGTWSDTLNFSHSNGFFKVISIINGQGVAYPYAAEAAVSLIDNLTNPDLPSRGNACEVYNVWNAINSLDSNPAKTNTVYAKVTEDDVTVANEGDEGAVEMTVSQFIAKSLEVRGADAVRITFDKIKGYQKADGSFSHSYTSGGTMHQGCPVAPAGNMGGDVDATCISSTGLIRSMFSAFNLDSYRPYFFGEADYIRFIHTLEVMEPVRKADADKLIEDFEDGLYKNNIEGDFAVENGKLNISGEASISLSELSTKGTRLAVSASITLTSSVRLNVLSGNKVIDTLTLSVDNGVCALERKSTASTAYPDISGGEVKLHLLYYLEDGALVSELLSSGALLMKDKQSADISSLSDITSLTIASESTTLDNMTFALITPENSIINDNGFIDFSGFTVGELDVGLASSGINFTNQTADGPTKSYALIISENSNKYLRLDDNCSSPDGTQNYFDFKNSDKKAATVVFETRMRIDREAGGVIPITVRSASGGAYYGGLNIVSGYLYAGVENKKSGLASTLIATDVKENEWFTLRMEYTAAATYSEDSFLCSIYINGKLIDSDTRKCDGLVYAPAASVLSFRMACDTNWLGTLDYDDIYVGSLEDYGGGNSSPTSHTHLTDTEITDVIDSTCTEDGSYVLKTFCSVASCGKVLSRVILPIPAGHKPATKEENRIEPTCTAEGSFELVGYCSGCGLELSRELCVLQTAPHSVVGDRCTECGVEGFVAEGLIDFEDMEAQSFLAPDGTVTNANLPVALNGSYIHLYAPKTHANMAVVTEDGDKILSCEKVINTTNSNTWVDFIRNTSVSADTIHFETRFKYESTALGGGIYVRLYTGRTTSGGGTRVTYHVLKTSSGYLTYQGAKTHVKSGEWCTLRITLEKTDTGYLYSFLVKNETGSSITSGGTSYGVGEFIPYHVTSELLIELEDINDVNAITFMHSTGCLTNLSFNNCYFGGTPHYVLKGEQ